MKHRPAQLFAAINLQTYASTLMAAIAHLSVAGRQASIRAVTHMQLQAHESGSPDVAGYIYLSCDQAQYPDRIRILAAFSESLTMSSVDSEDLHWQPITYRSAWPDDGAVMVLQAAYDQMFAAAAAFAPPDTDFILRLRLDNLQFGSLPREDAFAAVAPDSAGTFNLTEK